MEKEIIKKYIALPFTEFIGKTEQELYHHLLINYKERLPTIEDREYIYNNKEEFPELMKCKLCSFSFFGTIIRTPDENTKRIFKWMEPILPLVPCFTVNCYGLPGLCFGWLGTSWNCNGRVVLYESDTNQ